MADNGSKSGCAIQYIMHDAMHVVNLNSLLGQSSLARTFHLCLCDLFLVLGQ